MALRAEKWASDGTWRGPEGIECQFVASDGTQVAPGGAQTASWVNK